MGVPLFTPGVIVDRKLDELNGRMDKLWNTYKAMNPPIDQFGVPMVWNRITQAYDLSPFNIDGTYR